VQLSLVPLVGALAAGNAIYLKLSRHSPHTSTCLERLLLDVLDRRAVAIESEGGASTITALNLEQWDRTLIC
jgi:aldehyde dehydrogenase (NAD+)